jgi:methyl-galactoside transport system substrate-binding protein
MKKTLISVLALALILCGLFFGCKKQAGGQAQIGVAVYKADDTFVSHILNSIELNARDKAALTTVDSGNDQPAQNEQVDQFVAGKMNAIAINPVDRSAAGAIIDKAKAGNVPVVFFNREPFAGDMKKRDKVFYVGAMAEESGAMQGEILAEYWKANPGADKNSDGVIQYILFKGETGHQDAELRTEYSIKAVQAAGFTVELLDEYTALWDRFYAEGKMDGFWSQYGDLIEAVLCNNDDMALGVIDSLRSAGIFSGEKYIPVVGVDATAPALQALAEGALLGTVLNDAQNQGKAVFDIAFALASGVKPSAAGWTITDGKYIWIPCQKVTRDNYQNFQ